MLCLVYISAGRANLGPADVADILAVSRQRNAENGLTGLLLHADGNFIQVLEGPADAVERVFTKISRDDRHSGIQILIRAALPERQFAKWTMAFRNKRDLSLIDQLKFEGSLSQWRSAPGQFGADTEALVLMRSFARTM